MPEINDNAIVDAKRFQLAWNKIKELFLNTSTAINQNTTNITNLTSTVTQNTSDITNLTSTVTQNTTDISNLTSTVTQLNNVASTSTNGLMSFEDKIFIDGIKSNFDDNLMIPLVSTVQNGLMSSTDKEFIENINNGSLQIGNTVLTEQNLIDLLNLLNNNS